MRKEEISASSIVQDYNKRGIVPDWQHEVTQGILRVWLFCNCFIVELYIGSDNGKSIPGTLKITSKYKYSNTHSPQAIADDLIIESTLTKVDIEVLTPSQMGKIGGSVKSDAKAAASKANGKKGGRPKKIKE